MKISVCITTYNVAPFIAKALDSVLMQQTKHSFEICVSDDLSTDNTREILVSYQKRYPDIIRLNLPDIHRDVLKGDYDLIMMARGEYIAWLDGDDHWITSDKLDKQADILDRNPAFSCVRTNWRSHFLSNDKFEDVVVRGHHIDEEMWRRESEDRSPVDMLYNGVVRSQSKPVRYVSCDRFSTLMCRSSALVDYLAKDSDIMLSPDNWRCNDRIIMAILINAGAIYHLDEVTTMYIVRAESLCRSKDNNVMILKFLARMSATCHILRAFNVSKKWRDKICNRMLKDILKIAIHNGDEQTVLKALSYAERCGFDNFNLKNRLLLMSFKCKFIGALNRSIFRYKIYKT